MAATRYLYPLWRALPRSLRRAMYERATGMLASDAVWTDVTPREPTPPIVVAGVLSAPSGLGEAARLLLQGVIASGAEVSAIDLAAPLMQKQVLPVPHLPPPRPGPGTILLATQPPNIARSVALIGPEILRDKLRIGCWAWELEVLPAIWVRQAKHVHRIAAPSVFCQEAFARAFGREILLLPWPVATRSIEATRSRTGPVTFAAALDLGSTAARKNPLGVLRAFRLAFEVGADVRLKLKIRDAEQDPSAMAQVRQLVAQYAPAVELETRDLDADAFEAWWRTVDVFVSLHRSEGFGLLVAEAMLRGIPVVSTDWSATSEFVTAATGWPVRADLIAVVDDTERYILPGARWAEPDAQAAAAAMREATDRRRVAEKGRAARAHIEARFSNQAFGERLFSRGHAGGVQ